jgi:D-lyxose ketol-isomerase
MKRSEINAIIRDAIAFLEKRNVHLPPFAFWSPETWATKGAEVAGIVGPRLGWDVTDFGQDDYHHIGLCVFTLRNGIAANLETRQGKTYAEKVLIVDPQQVTPLHFHRVKMEDIINRGGGKLIVQLYNSTPDEELADTDVTVSIDGSDRTVQAGGSVTLHPGESITLRPYCYHTFWGEEARVLVGEVSLVNDDHTDNRFYPPMARFSTLEEDEPPLHLLVNDYDTYYHPQ